MFIKKKQLKFKQVENFDWRKLMTNPNNTLHDEALLKKYDELSAAYHFRIKHDEDDENENNVSYIISDIKRELLDFQHSEVDITDMLVAYLYPQDSEAKMLLWACFGDVLLKNLKQHINPRETYCRHCGRRFIPRANAHRYCDACFAEKNCKPDERIVICKDCGKVFTVPKSNRSKTRCDECQKSARREAVRKNVQRFRERQAM